MKIETDECNQRPVISQRRRKEHLRQTRDMKEIKRFKVIGSGNTYQGPQHLTEGPLDDVSGPQRLSAICGWDPQ